MREAADALRYRDFLTVALVVPTEAGFPDNWIYVHDPGVQVGRIQNFGAWSPDMVRDGGTCLGLEYFVNEGDELWRRPTPSWSPSAPPSWSGSAWSPRLGRPPGTWCGCRRPTRSTTRATREAVEVIRRWLAEAVPNVHPVGRNGMHRYNNQDHSMLTAMLAAENILDGTDHDVWSVNVEEDYHEEGGSDGAGQGGSGQSGTGRAAPVVPRPRTAPPAGDRSPTG